MDDIGEFIKDLSKNPFGICLLIFIGIPLLVGVGIPLAFIVLALGCLASPFIACWLCGRCVKTFCCDAANETTEKFANYPCSLTPEQCAVLDVSSTIDESRKKSAIEILTKLKSYTDAQTSADSKLIKKEFKKELRKIQTELKLNENTPKKISVSKSENSIRHWIFRTKKTNDTSHQPTGSFLRKKAS